MTREEIFRQMYTGDTVYPPPLESKSALLEVTTGCSYRKCRFCDFPKDRFTVASMDQIRYRVELLRLVINGNPKLHLLGCNPFCLPARQLLSILKLVRNRLDCVREVSMYARADDVLRKSDEELKLLSQAGLTALHIGFESGSDAILALHEKGETVADLDAALNALDRCGILYHLTAIPGLGGRELSEEHALRTASFLSKHTPLSVWNIALKVWPDTPLSQMVEEGSFQPMTYLEILKEERELVSRIRPQKPFLYVDSTVLGAYTLMAMLPDQQQILLSQMDALIAQEEAGQTC